VALERLGIADQISERLSVDQMLPQVGQGAVAVECRLDDTATIAALAAVNNIAT
jgi:hydroxymethylbilane synthase